MFPNLLYFFWLLLQSVTAFSLIVPTILCLVYFMRIRWKSLSITDEELHEEKDYAIIIPAIDTTDKIQSLLRSLQRLNYTNYIIYVAGKQPLQMEANLYNDNIVYLRTVTSYNNQAIFYRYVIESFRRPHTHLAILNSNQLVDENYLTNLNSFFNQGYQVVKSNEVYTSNKTMGSIAQLATHAYRNFFGGKMMFGLGSSATLSVAGIAFQVTLFKQCIKKIKGDDSDLISVLQTRIIERGHRVAFASQAIVYTDKPAGIKELVKHHALRIHSWIINLFFYGKTAMKGLFRGNVNQFLYGVLAARLPLPTSALAASACFVVNIRIHPAIAFFWAGCLLLLPVYSMISAQQLPGIKMMTAEADKEDSESVSLYSTEEEYSALAQTV